MKRLAHIVVAVVLLALVLIGCSDFVAINSVDFSTNVEPAPLGYEVDESGALTITTRTVTFRSAPGALGATVEGYSVEYVDGDGTVLSDGSSSGVLGVFVPPGITCDDPDPERGCTIHSTNRSFAVGPAVQSGEIQLLDAAAAEAHLLAGAPTDWRALVTYNGRSSTGASFAITKEYKLTPPN